MYLTNPGNVIQALDAATGELLWEYRRELPRAARPYPSGPSGIAIFGDRIFLDTSDAHVVALDAQTGTVDWDVEVADHLKGSRTQRSSRRGWEDHLRHHRVPALQHRQLLHHRASPGDRRRALAHVHHRPARGAGW